MADKTGISWTDATWNPIRGCSRVSEGCRNCYAERVAARFSGPGQPYEGLATVARWTGAVRMAPEHLADPLRWRKPRRIFVNSMSDLFHEALTNEQIAAVFGVMAAAPQHTFQVLTKRAKRMREWFAWVEKRAEDGKRMFPDDDREWRIRQMLTVELGATGNRVVHHGGPWPLPNVWIGVSVENQAAADERIPELLATPAAVRFLSCEPLLERVDLDAVQIPGEREGLRFSALRHQHDDRFGSSDVLIDWVIAGCESGRGARPCDVAWLRSLRDQCSAAAVPFFLKQSQAQSIDRTVKIGGEWIDPVGAGAGSKRKAGGVIELPYLDGVQHAAFPELHQVVP